MTSNSKNNKKESPKEKPKVLAIFGPTASGKSNLAVYLAKKFNGEVVSADSRQVYKGMDLGTGKITKKEMAGIKHYCLDIASPKRQFSAAQFQKKAKKAIKEILKKGKLPIVCGGSNFWLHTLIEGLVLPEAKPDKKLRERLEKLPKEKLYELLKKADKRRAKTIEKENKRRLVRALEIIIQTKKPVPEKQFKKEYNVLKLAIKTKREELKNKIKERLKKRLKQGMIEEVKKLRKQGLSWKRLESFGLEYKWLSLYLQKKINRQEMEKNLFKDIIRYAKKQISWLKNKEASLFWVKNKKEAQKIVKQWLEN